MPLRSPNSFPYFFSCPATSQTWHTYIYTLAYAYTERHQLLPINLAFELFLGLGKQEASGQGRVWPGGSWKGISEWSSHA